MENEKMNKRPSLQFYPADWLKDPDLQICSMNTIGIWINLMCRMWEAKEEGVLRGEPEELALLVGARPIEFEKFLNEVIVHSFADVTKCDKIVTIKCRRVNRAFLEREGAKQRMRKHRNANVTSNVAPYSSSSTSSSTTKHKEKAIFEEIRKLFPGTKRGLQTEFDNFTQKHKDWQIILPLLKSAVEKQIEWREDAEGEWRPPWKIFGTWINNRNWEDEISTEEEVPFDYECAAQRKAMQSERPKS